MRVGLFIVGGPMHGQVFDADLDEPWPERLIGQDIHRELVGTYELEEAQPKLLQYRLREDDDYVRLLSHVALRGVH